MLVLLLAVVCKCHPAQSSKLLSRILGYIGIRLRDNETKVTEACGILVSSIVLHVVPHCAATDNADESSAARDAMETQPERVDKWHQVFANVSAPLIKEMNAVGENATKCLCSLLRPTEFDGQTLPSKEDTLAHATRLHSFFQSILSASVSKMNGSTMYGSFSPIFLLLQSACQIAHDVRVRTGMKELFACIAPHVGFIFEAIEDVFQYGPREDWVLRKRGMELLALLLEDFGLSDDAIAESAREYFRAHLVRTSSRLGGNGAQKVYLTFLPPTFAGACAKSRRVWEA